MKILTLFGSISDERIYAPLCESLGKKHQVKMEVISAHRNPVELEKVLETSDCDIIIGGAGLAAHLPGVVASKTSKPVFGIPVDGNFGGLDAFLSIVQMPFGVPVLSIAPNKENLIEEFLDIVTIELFKTKTFEIIINPKILDYEYVTLELFRATKYAESIGYNVEVLGKPTGLSPAIVYVNDDREILLEGPCIHIPILDKSHKLNPNSANQFMNSASQGGMWCGANNSRNAMSFWNKLEQL
ncbi:MAG: AIR carboxylase family protein [Bacteriovoracaceae bacterium]|jgi:5-(carboxyamino)imidazole ribonucleotide mutase|nr:AIR carboxylase family protein [Bacteriovoracaceae bacterium]